MRSPDTFDPLNVASPSCASFQHQRQAELQQITSFDQFYFTPYIHTNPDVAASEFVRKESAAMGE